MTFNLGDEVSIPQAVYDEFVATGRALRQAALENTPWIKPVPLANPQRARVYIGLDQGEAQVLALAEERAARLVIVDELKGRRYAQRLELPLNGENSGKRSALQYCGAKGPYAGIF
jgi:predicted nucleic acid-binding protein